MVAKSAYDQVQDLKARSRAMEAQLKAQAQAAVLQSGQSSVGGGTTGVPRGQSLAGPAMPYYSGPIGPVTTFRVPDYVSLAGIDKMLSGVNYHWRGRPESTNIEDRRAQSTPSPNAAPPGFHAYIPKFPVADATPSKFTDPTKGGMSDPTVVKTIIHEAGPDPKAQAAVAYVIRNRAEQTGKSPLEVVKQKHQFEGYENPGYGAVKAANDPNIRAKATQVAQDVAAGKIADPTGGGLYFHADNMTPGWAKSANKNGTVNIGGNVFYKGSGTPATALAAIDRAVAPNPQSRPPALAYGDAPASVRAISVKPNGQPADLMSGLGAKYPGLNFTMSGTTDAAVTGMKRPPALPVASPPLISRSVNTVQINPNTGNPYSGVELAQVAAERAAGRLRGDMPGGKVASIAPIRPPQPTTPSRSVEPVSNQPAPPKVTFSGNGLNSPQTQFQKANQDAIINAARNIPIIGPIVGGAQSAASLLTSQPPRANPPPVYQPQPSAAQKAALAYVPTSVSGVNSRLADIHDARDTAYAPNRPITPVGGKNTDKLGVTPPTLLAFNGDQDTGIPAIGAMPPVGALPRVPPPVPRPVPSYRLPIVPTAPKLTFPSQVWNAATAAANHSPVGHIAQLLTGKPVTGGLLAMLQGTPIQAGRLINGGVLSQPQTAFTASQAAAGSPIALASSGGGGLAGGSLFDRNAQLPGSMDNRRWAGDGY